MIFFYFFGTYKEVRQVTLFPATYLYLLSENVINFVRIWLFLKKKNIVNLGKTWIFFENEAGYARTTVRNYFTPQM